MLQNSVLLGANAPASATAPTVSNTATKTFAVRLDSIKSTDSIKSNGKQMVIYEAELIDFPGEFIDAVFTIKYQKSLTGELMVDKDGKYIPVDGVAPNVGTRATVYGSSYINKLGVKTPWFEISRKGRAGDPAHTIALLGL
jgi:hypothetical protein